MSILNNAFHRPPQKHDKGPGKEKRRGETVGEKSKRHRTNILPIDVANALNAKQELVFKKTNIAYK